MHIHDVYEIFSRLFFPFQVLFFQKQVYKFLSGLYSESCKAYKMELFAKIVNDLSSILDI